MPAVLIPEKKKERLEARISSELKERLQLAASLQGRTLTDFVVASAQQIADTTIREHLVLTLSENDGRAFVDALMNPPAPNGKLRAAADRYKQELAKET